MIVVVGGGASGIMAAIAAAEAGREQARPSDTPPAEVTVLDAGEPLSKLLRTGGGRCNLTNAVSDPRRLIEAYPRGGKFLLSAFHRVGTVEVMAWFSARGLDLKIEEDGRVFPASGRAAEVKDILLSTARHLGVRVRGRTPALGLSPREAGFTVHTPRQELQADAVILATGGDWHDRKGSGYRLARELGHGVTPLRPSLSGLVLRGSRAGRLAGLTMPDARIRAFFKGQREADERGSLLFTHKGVSGPVVFRVSSRCAFIPYSPSSPLELSISFVPDRTAGKLAERLEELLTRRPRQNTVSALRTFLPRSIAEAVVEEAGAAPTLPAGQVSRAVRERIARLVTGFAMEAVGLDHGGEIVTAGGIRLQEVDPRTMESRMRPGLFFCGEILDIDGFTGGYNLQAAWATGRLAGLSAGGRIP
jgi:predicted Rossmann fold flavoprotein